MAKSAAKIRDIGLNVVPPKNSCDDINCPFHGSLSTRGKIFEGIVVSAKPNKTVSVRWESIRTVPKYERFMKKSSKVAAHNPPCIDAMEGDIVKIVECRKLSKTKTFVVVEKRANIKAKVKVKDENERKVKKNESVKQ